MYQVIYFVEIDLKLFIEKHYLSRLVDSNLTSISSFKSRTSSASSGFADGSSFFPYFCAYGTNSELETLLILYFWPTRVNPLLLDHVQHKKKKLSRFAETAVYTKNQLFGVLFQGKMIIDHSITKVHGSILFRWYAK